MPLETVYYLGQTVAVIALLISLIFVGVQIRQNTKATKAASHHAITDSFNQFNSIIGTNQESARVWRLGLLGMENLNEDEQLSFAFLNLGYSRIFETLYYQKHNGTLEAELLKAERRSLAWAASYPGYREWWKGNKISLCDDFRAYVDQIVAEAEENLELTKPVSG